MAEKPIRVGIIGAGENTRTMHLPRLQAIDGVEIISVCNRSRASSERVAAAFSIPQVFANWWELVADPGSDAIVIGTWPYLHCQATLAALAADKHVMVEARMAMNATEAARMHSAAQAKPHLITQVVPGPLSFGVDATMQHLIADGFLGDILAIEVRHHGRAFLDRDGPLHWRQDSVRSGVNMLALGIWYESLLRWVGEATAVTAMGKTFVTMRADPETGQMTPVRLPDHLTVLADMACGAQATFIMSQVTGLRAAQEAVLHGRDGTLRYRDQALTGGRRGDTALHEIPIPETARGAWRVEEEFVNAIRGYESIKYTTFATGLKYMRFVDAVAQSLITGQRLPV